MPGCLAIIVAIPTLGMVKRQKPIRWGKKRRTRLQPVYRRSPRW
jgi:hypothetical protein